MTLVQHVEGVASWIYATQLDDLRAMDQVEMEINEEERKF